MAVTTHPGPRRLLQLGCVLTAAGLVAGCAPEPARENTLAETNAVRVAIDNESTTQWVVGELYMRTLNKSGRDAVPYLLNEDSSVATRIDALTTGTADVVVGCAGQLLDELNPTEAKKLSEQYSQALAAGTIDPNDGSWREKVYTALVNSLPGDLAATDPSNAVICPETTEPPLPQNAVPIYRKPTLSRPERLILNKVTGTITTSDIKQLTSEVDNRSSVSEALSEYMRSHDLE